MEETLEFFSDPVVWYTIAFVVCVFLLYRLGGKPVVALIDSEIAKIREELEEASRLRREAEARLEECAAKQRDATKEAAAIIARAKEEAAHLKAEAEAGLESFLANQEHRAYERIRQAEAEAMVQVRQSMVEMAVTAARRHLAERMDDETSQRLLEEAIDSTARLAEKNSA